MFGLFKKTQTTGPTADQIVPRIKHSNFLLTVREFTATKPGSMPVTKPLAADLLVTYAFDLPSTFQMVTENDRQRLNVSVDELHVRAVGNLRKQLPPCEQGGTPPVILLRVGSNMEACLLLIDELWESVAANVPGKVVVSVPTRDILMFTSSESTLGVKALRELAVEARAKEPVHGLTESLLVWENRQWLDFNNSI